MWSIIHPYLSGLIWSRTTKFYRIFLYFLFMTCRFLLEDQQLFCLSFNTNNVYHIWTYSTLCMTGIFNYLNLISILYEIYFSCQLTLQYLLLHDISSCQIRNFSWKSYHHIKLWESISIIRVPLLYNDLMMLIFMGARTILMLLLHVNLFANIQLHQSGTPDYLKACFRKRRPPVVIITHTVKFTSAMLYIAVHAQ